MTPEEAAQLDTGLRIVLAALQDNEAELGRLLDAHTTEELFPKLADAFIYVALTAVDTVAHGRKIPFIQALPMLFQCSAMAMFLGRTSCSRAVAVDCSSTLGESVVRSPTTWPSSPQRSSLGQKRGNEPSPLLGLSASIRTGRKDGLTSSVQPACRSRSNAPAFRTGSQRVHSQPTTYLPRSEETRDGTEIRFISHPHVESPTDYL